MHDQIHPNIVQLSVHSQIQVITRQFHGRIVRDHWLFVFVFGSNRVYTFVFALALNVKLEMSMRARLRGYLCTQSAFHPFFVLLGLAWLFVLIPFINRRYFYRSHFSQVYSFNHFYANVHFNKIITQIWHIR